MNVCVAISNASVSTPPLASLSTRGAHNADIDLPDRKLQVHRKRMLCKFRILAVEHYLSLTGNWQQ